MKNVFKWLVALCCAVFAAQASVSGAPPRPNIVFFLVDDLGWPDVGCYGSSFYETPAIDQMAKEGVKFDNAYATCHVCSPSRASILTGKYPARTDLTEWLGGKAEQVYEKLHSAEKADALPVGEITIAETLRSHGYATANYGKAHVGRNPKNYGFDEAITGWVQSYYYPFGGAYDQTLPAEEGDYFTDKLTDAVLEFIERKKDQPFFVHLEHFAVHDPIQGRKDFVEKYKEKLAGMPLDEGPDYILEGNPDEPAPSEASLAEMIINQRAEDFITNRVGWVKQKQDNVEFAGMVSAMDESLARIRAKLEELNIADNTIIIFTSDNGGMSASNRFRNDQERAQLDKRFSSSMLPLRGGKGWLYEGGIRVPLIVVWPGHTEPGMVTDVPVIGTDFYPTLLEMLDLPLMPEQHKDGISFVPLLEGEPFNGHDALYWHFPHYSNHGNQSPGGAIRVGKYMLLEYFENGTVQLFDLENDLGEQFDISKENPEITQNLLKMLQDWRKETDAKMPQRKADSKPAAYVELSTTTTFTGIGDLLNIVYSNTTPVMGTVISGNTGDWSNGLPSNSNPGLFSGGTRTFTGTQNHMYGVSLRQTGGTLSDTSLVMRGGAEDDSTTHCILEIDDASNTGFGYKNLDISGIFTLWPQFGYANFNTLSLLNGWADVGKLNGTAVGNNIINILNGKLDVGYFHSAKLTVNMLAGGTGQFILADMDDKGVATAQLTQMLLKFEPGSAASFTIASSNVTGNAQGAWETFVAAGRAKIDGVVETDLSQFKIEDVGATGTKISLAPLELELSDYDTWAGNFAPADLSDPTGDFDGDGLDNLMEYALGGIPTNAEAASIAPVFQPLENYFFHVHNERTDDSNLTYTVELSTNLVSNGWKTNGLEFVGAAGFSNVWNVVTHKVPTLGKDQQFIRLKIEKD